MILRDPVHGLVAFEGDDERVVMALLETREVQRLRRVRQLGLTSLVFPGAEHSRFAHALGAAHVMVRLLAHLADRQASLPPELRLDAEARRDAIAAALLHDLGHGPFSHLFEDVLPELPSGAGPGSTPKHHEDWTAEILLDPSTEVHRALESLSRGMSERVVALLRGTASRPWLSRSVSGTLDVDRSDYLLRDSESTGVRYGVYDLDWLLRALTFAQLSDGEWVLAIEGRKGLPPIEGFFLARHFMYQQVYHHKATRAAECVIRATFTRIAELARDGAAPQGTPPGVIDAVLGAPISLGDYLALDDPTLITGFAEWERHPDPALSELAGRLRHRRLPKTIPLPDQVGADEVWARAHAIASGIARDRGMRPELSVWLDVPTDVPYFEPSEPLSDGLWVQVSHQPMIRLGEASFLLRQLRNQTIVRPRLVFSDTIRVSVEDAVEEVLGG